MILLTTGLSALSQGKYADRFLIKNDKLKHSFIGICIYDPEEGKIIYKYNAFRYFTPASNTKLYSFYAGLRYLEDSTTGIQYQRTADTLYIRGTGDPTFLHPDFDQQPAYDFLKESSLPIAIIDTKNKNKFFGPGWAWGDYNAGYQPERSSFPIYGNVVRFSIKNGQLKATPSFFFTPDKWVYDSRIPAHGFKIKRNRTDNLFYYNKPGPSTSKIQEVPFITSTSLLMSLLGDSLHREVYYSTARLPEDQWKEITNVPLDSMLKHTMYRSDNFYAEQTDAMVSMKLFDQINTQKLIKHLLKNDLKILPNKPVWVDGSGLSRYNLFSPADMITVLTLLYHSFPPERIFSLLPTGGKGTLKHLYRGMEGKIFAKTGSLNNNVTLSGFLITRKGHPLIFSIMINHLRKPLNTGRHAMENFLRTIYENY